ncbi:unnamed protein product [Echinostoma caproni]|uniref:Uncharacterized protein n=1 Tax=Echinostoma caproni TaxID=27848 RepID=A0A3P8GVQ1_9TREM|nr:unnamed protein product [Echinostoma caproni]
MSEDDRRTVNSLLRLSICQKLALTQRIEELEVLLESNGISLPGPRRQQHPLPPAPYASPQSQNPSMTCANSLLPNPMHPQAYIMGHHPVPAQPFNTPDPSGLTRGGGVPQQSGLPVHPTILSPQHANPNSHTGAKFVSSGPDRSKACLRFN